MKKINWKKILIIIGSVIGGIALIIGTMLLIYRIQCSNISSKERRAMRICEDSGYFSDVKYANFLKSSHNGYVQYDYYDVSTENGTYIVELRDDGDTLAYSSKMGYSGPFNRRTILNDKIAYRNSDMGSLGDSIEAELDR